MGKKEAIPNRRYTDEFKLEAVRLAESVGGNQAAKRLGIADSNIWNWIKLSRAGKLNAAQGGATPIKRGASELEAEVSRLRRELANAKADLDIVKKAAAFFAKESR
jgi:transposase